MGRNNSISIKQFGSAGHFICGLDCRFHLATQVGDYFVSTVGQYLPDEGIREILAKSRNVELEGRGDTRRADYMNKIGYEKIGCDRLFETMVFKAGKPCDTKDCGCGMPEIDGQELDFNGYNTPKDATEGHEEMVKKYLRIAKNNKG